MKYSILIQTAVYTSSFPIKEIGSCTSTTASFDTVEEAEAAFEIIENNGSYGRISITAMRLYNLSSSAKEKFDDLIDDITTTINNIDGNYYGMEAAMFISGTLIDIRDKLITLKP